MWFDRSLVLVFSAAMGVASISSTALAGNSALQYDGGDFSRVPGNAALTAIEANDVISVQSWIRIGSYPQGWFPVIDKYRTATDFGWAFQVFGGPSPNLQFVGGAGPTASVPWTPPLNQWVNVAFTYQRSEGVIRFYVDGGLLGAPAYTADIQSTASTDPLFIGYGPSGGDEYAQGAIDELRIWNRALSASEIASNYARSLVGNEAGLVGYWRFDEGAGATFADATASANQGTLGTGTNQPTWLASGAPIPEPTCALLLLGSAAAARRRARRG